MGRVSDDLEPGRVNVADVAVITGSREEITLIFGNFPLLFPLVPFFFFFLVAWMGTYRTERWCRVEIDIELALNPRDPLPCRTPTTRDDRGHRGERHRSRPSAFNTHPKKGGYTFVQSE